LDLSKGRAIQKETLLVSHRKGKKEGVIERSGWEKKKTFGRALLHGGNRQAGMDLRGEKTGISKGKRPSRKLGERGAGHASRVEERRHKGGGFE